MIGVTIQHFYMRTSLKNFRSIFNTIKTSYYHICKVLLLNLEHTRKRKRPMIQVMMKLLLQRKVLGLHLLEAKEGLRQLLLSQLQQRPLSLKWTFWVWMHQLNSLQLLLPKINWMTFLEIVVVLQHKLKLNLVLLMDLVISNQIQVLHKQTLCSNHQVKQILQQVVPIWLSKQ